MSAFEQALSEYREALLRAAADMRTDTQRRLYQLHLGTLADIEQRYSQTSDPNMCRLLMECEHIVYDSDILQGPQVEQLRVAFARLLETVTP